MQISSRKNCGPVISGKGSFTLFGFKIKYPRAFSTNQFKTLKESERELEEYNKKSVEAYKIINRNKIDDAAKKALFYDLNLDFTKKMYEAKEYIVNRVDADMFVDENQYRDFLAKVNSYIIPVTSVYPYYEFIVNSLKKCGLKILKRTILGNEDDIKNNRDIPSMKIVATLPGYDDYRFVIDDLMMFRFTVSNVADDNISALFTRNAKMYNKLKNGIDYDLKKIADVVGMIPDFEKERQKELEAMEADEKRWQEEYDRSSEIDKAYMRFKRANPNGRWSWD